MHPFVVGNGEVAAPEAVGTTFHTPLEHIGILVVKSPSGVEILSGHDELLPTADLVIPELDGDLTEIREFRSDGDAHEITISEVEGVGIGEGIGCAFGFCDGEGDGLAFADGDVALFDLGEGGEGHQEGGEEQQQGAHGKRFGITKIPALLCKT